MRLSTPVASLPVFARLSLVNLQANAGQWRHTLYLI
jgi:hypothetical protein